MNFPIFIENSNVPRWLSKISPIDIYAISFGFWVWCRSAMTPRLRVHEAIHYRQQLEMLFVFQWIFYGLFWLIGMIRYRDGSKAYYESPFEREAYANEDDLGYLHNRRPYAWVRYIL